jgi:hypothetical protein
VFVFSSLEIGNGNMLLSGENGMELVSLSLNSTASKNQKILNTFNVPVFSVKNQTKHLKVIGDTNMTSDVKKSEIYSMMKKDNAIFIGGLFDFVNGKEAKNLIKLKSDGTIDNSFSANVLGGGVQSMIATSEGLLIGGSFTNYNNIDVFGFAKIDSNGQLDENFMPFKNYLYAEVNDIVVLANGNIVLAGIFIKNDTSYTITDINVSNIDEVISHTSAVVIINENGTINNKLTDKLSYMNKEAYKLKYDLDSEKLYIGGDFKIEKDFKEYINVVRVSTDMTLDTEFQVEKLLGQVYDIDFVNNTIAIVGDFVSVKDDDTIRSLMFVDKAGKTIETKLSTDCAEVYHVNKTNGKIMLLGNGKFTINGSTFSNNIIFTIK